MNPDRRKFLIRTGWVAAGLTVVGVGGVAALPPLPTFSASSEKDIHTWVQMRNDGRIRFYLSRAEMGQEISTSFSQVVAEELNVPLASIECLYQNTQAMAPCQMTVGSQSVENYFELTARAAATLRERLRVKAAEKTGLEVDQLQSVNNGFSTPSTALISYASLFAPDPVAPDTFAPDTVAPDTVAPETRSAETIAAEDLVLETIDAEIAEDAIEIYSTRAPAQLRHVGKSVPPVRGLQIVTGAETYSRDVVIEGMLFGALARPPQLGAELLGFDRSAAMQVEGTEAVVEHKGEVGVVAITPMAAASAVAALNTQWSPVEAEALSRANQHILDIDNALELGDLSHISKMNGAVELGKATTNQTFSYRYDCPMIAHASMEPRAGVAHWHREDKTCEVWTGSQDPWMVRSAVARSLGARKSKITVNNHRIGGAFGGRVLCQASVEAAWLSRAVERPVKVQWSREDEFRHNYVGPPVSTRINAGLDSEGKISYWHHQAVGAPVLTSSKIVPSYLHWAADLAPDPGTKRGMETPYQFKHHQLDFSIERLTMPTGPWRGLAAAPNTFAVECAMDELAIAANQDPINFRLQHLKHDRLSACLQKLQTKLGARQHQFGVAVAAYKEVTYVALAVRVEQSGSRFVVKEVVCVHDCGRVISPDKVRAQIEGNLVWGIGMALLETFELEKGIASTENFGRYTIPRQQDVPPIDIVLVESDLPPSGAAEAAIAPAAAAIINAIYVLSGNRYRQLPVTGAESVGDTAAVEAPQKKLSS